MATDRNKSDGHSASAQTSSQAGKGNTEKANPAAIERYIKGVNFPATKDKLVYQAKQNGAPDDILNSVSKLSDKEYNSSSDISKEMSKLNA